MSKLETTGKDNGNMAGQCLAEMPDPFVRNDGSRLEKPGDWPARRAEIAANIIAAEYGGLPPPPLSLQLELMNSSMVRNYHAVYSQYKIILGEHPAFHFRLDLMVPRADSAVPVILTGDGCYLKVTDQLRREIIDRGFALAVFSRTSVVPDVASAGRDSLLYRLYPGQTFGALAAWAWGYHRAVDALERIEGVDASRIAITGHSRGGKTVLLAGATDERIALTAPNASGLGGAGSYLFYGPKSERLAGMIRNFPHWLGPEMRQFIDREEKLAFDQHFLKAMVAPRAYFNTNGYDDLHANPAGTWQTHMAAREVYRFLGVADRMGIFYRPGGHEHGSEDWQAFLDFAQAQLLADRDIQTPGINPYPGMEPAFSWKAPGS